MFQEYKKYIIAAIAAVVVIGGGIGAYVLTRPEPEAPAKTPNPAHPHHSAHKSPRMPVPAHRR